MMPPLYSTTVSKIKSLGWRGWAVAGLAAFALAWVLVPPAPGTIEAWYTRGIYRYFVGGLTPITEAVPFSIALVLLFVALLGLPTSWVLAWRGQGRRGVPRWRRALWCLRTTGVVLLAIFVWFIVLWGAGYRRPPAEARLHLDATPVSNEESATLRAGLLALVRENVQPEEVRDADAAIAAIADAMEEVVAAWDGESIRLPRRVKATPPGFLLVQGSAGVCAPFTLEPHVDGALVPTSFVHVAAHELGHVAGFNAEDEATLAGFVAGLRADNAFARYAVALDAYLDLVRALPWPAQAPAIADLPEQAKRDLEAARQVSLRYRWEPVQKVQQKVYNQYLKAQGIEEGVENYSRGILLLALVWRDGKTLLPGLAPPGTEIHSAAQAEPASTS